MTTERYFRAPLIAAAGLAVTCFGSGAFAAGKDLVIGVTTGSYSQVQLQACAPTHILPSVAEVPALVLTEAASQFDKA